MSIVSEPSVTTYSVNGLTLPAILYDVKQIYKSLSSRCLLTRCRRQSQAAESIARQQRAGLRRIRNHNVIGGAILLLQSHRAKQRWIDGAHIAG